MGYIILMRVGQDSKIIQEERNSCSYALSSSCRNITPAIAVVERCKTDILAFHTMLFPGATLDRCFINKHSDTGWRHGCGIIVKHSVKMTEC